MRKRQTLRLVALLLLLTVLLQGCIFRREVDPLDYLYVPEDTERPDDTTDPKPDKPDDDAFQRQDFAYLEEVPFGELEYERPDAEQLIADITSLHELVESGANALEIVSAHKPIYEDYCYFSTMSQYAYIRYTLDLNDEYFDTEYNWCDQQSPLVEQAWEKCYIAMADSTERDTLENLHFGKDFFEYYDNNEVYSNDRVVALMQEESDLQSQYMAMQSDMTITWEGEERLVSELLEDTTLAYTEYLTVYEKYYNKYNPIAADIFVELIRVRKEIATELDYDSYADFAYGFYYFRDYTPEQVMQYIDDAAKELGEFYYRAGTGSSSKAMDIETTQDLLAKLADSFGGEIKQAYDYMIEYDLCDFSESTSKMPGSYMTYLPSYGMPYMYVSPTGTIGDLLTATHEFGHFVDGYVNCNYTNSIDCAEIFSQGLEFLALDRADLTPRQREDLTYSKLSDAALVFLTQSCYAEFEHRAYELPEEELTAENLNALFWDCMDHFGMATYGMDDVLSPSWIDIQHFFIAPMYVISYCISNDAALQIYQIELESGNGLEVYRDLMSKSANNTILALLDSADLDSPFAQGRMKDLAELFEEHMGY